MKFKVKDLSKCVSKTIVIPVGILKYSNKVLDFEPDRYGRWGIFMHDDWYFESEWLEPVEELAAPTKETTESDVVSLSNGIDLVNLINGKIPPQCPTYEESGPTLLTLPPESSKGHVFTSSHDTVSRPDHYHFSKYEQNDIDKDSENYKQSESIKLNVTKPNHYHFSEYEPIKIIQAWDLSFALGNVVKYIARAGRKDSSKLIEDLEKARRYIELELENLRKK